MQTTIFWNDGRRLVTTWYWLPWKWPLLPALSPRPIKLIPGSEGRLPRSTLDKTVDLRGEGNQSCLIESNSQLLLKSCWIFMDILDADLNNFCILLMYLMLSILQHLVYDGGPGWPPVHPLGQSSRECSSRRMRLMHHLKVAMDGHAGDGHAGDDDEDDVQTMWKCDSQKTWGNLRLQKMPIRSETDESLMNIMPVPNAVTWRVICPVPMRNNASGPGEKSPKVLFPSGR